MADEAFTVTANVPSSYPTYYGQVILNPPPFGMSVDVVNVKFQVVDSPTLLVDVSLLILTAYTAPGYTSGVRIPFEESASTSRSLDPIAKVEVSPSISL